jgi:hypothetical protein
MTLDIDLMYNPLPTYVDPMTNSDFIKISVPILGYIQLDPT